MLFVKILSTLLKKFSYGDFRTIFYFLNGLRVRPPPPHNGQLPLKNTKIESRWPLKDDDIQRSHNLGDLRYLLNCLLAEIPLPNNTMKVQSFLEFQEAFEVFDYLWRTKMMENAQI